MRLDMTLYASGTGHRQGCHLKTSPLETKLYYKHRIWTLMNA